MTDIPAKVTPEAAPGGKIQGLSVLKGLVLYGFVIAFAYLYIDFIVAIIGADGKPPDLDDTEVSVAAALAGVLGSAFALEIGTPTDARATNPKLNKALQESKGLKW